MRCLMGGVEVRRRPMKADRSPPEAGGQQAVGDADGPDAIER